MSDSTPLRKTPVKSKSTKLANVETNDLKKHYLYHASGFYASHEYADLALILKRRRPGF